jgi:integrating conjugative element protein (TIGR03755 family)
MSDFSGLTRLPCSKRSLVSYLSIAAAFALSTPIRAQSAWYYEFGGAEPINKPVWSSYNPVPLQVSGEFGWNYSCGKFSISNSVNRLLRDVATAADDYLNAMVANAQAAVASLPGIILQRANPTLYDMMQNGLLRAQATANAARLDCQAMEESIMANGSGIGGVWENLKQSAKITDWKAQATYSRNDIVQAQRNVEQNAGANGIPWIAAGGASARAGGVNQPVIKINADITGAGYDMAVSAGNPRFSNSNAAPLTAKNSKAFGLFQLFNAFPTKASAQEYVTRVIGDTAVTTTEGGLKTTQPGYGLNEEVVRETQRVLPLLTAAVNAGRAITNAEREQISPSAQLTDQLLRSIRDLPRQDRDLIVQRLAGEIAMTNTINKALMTINILRLGKTNPNVESYDMIVEMADQGIAELKTYVDDLMYETRIRKELVSETAVAILQRADAQRTGPVIEPERIDDQEPALGTVKKN